MAAPPEKKGRMEEVPEEKESTTITMVLEEWAEGQKEQFSPVHRIDGFPFRLRVERGKYRRMEVYVVCEKWRESELWQCTASIEQTHKQRSCEMSCTFGSWLRDKLRGERVHPWEETTEMSISSKVGSSVQVTIVVEEGEDSWSSPSLRPPLDSIKPADGILVIGEDKKEIRVNKEFLASQSPYFDRLFFGDFKEKDMDKIPIGGVEYEEFDNIIKMVYGSAESTLTDENVYKVLDLADRFELKIVEDKVVSYLLSNETRFSLARKLLISQERNISSLKKLCLEECRFFSDMREIKDAPEYADFSCTLKAEILDRVLDIDEY